MKQKIVLKVALDCDKCRSKALKIAAVAKGVSSVSIGGGDKDQVVVIGDGVDSVSLAKVLRKKFRHVSIVSVQEARDDGKEKKKKKEEERNKMPCPSWYYDPPYCSASSCPQVVYDPYPNTNCAIL